MRYFDLHCDTMTECLEKGKELCKNDLHIDLERAKKTFDGYVQCYAAWIPDSLHGDAAFRRFCEIAEKLCAEEQKNCALLERCRAEGDLCRAETNGKFGAVLTVENGSALGGKLENIQELKKRGVRMMTLTWNGENEIGRGVRSEGVIGLSDFGRQAVPELEQNGIVVDISHASPELFYDVAAIARKPFVASHSNAQKICSHPRNLTDEQFEAIRRSGGLVGLNFYEAFLNDKPEQASMQDVLRHAEYFLSLGGEDVLAVGGDLDGSTLPGDMPGIEALGSLYELFLRENYSESLVRKIFYENAVNFFKRNKLL